MSSNSLPRRRVVQGIAWSTPAIVATAAAPAHAASNTEANGTPEEALSWVIGCVSEPNPLQSYYLFGLGGGLGLPSKDGSGWEPFAGWSLTGVAMEYYGNGRWNPISLGRYPGDTSNGVFLTFGPESDPVAFPAVFDGTADYLDVVGWVPEDAPIAEDNPDGGLSGRAKYTFRNDATGESMDVIREFAVSVEAGAQPCLDRGGKYYLGLEACYIPASENSDGMAVLGGSIYTNPGEQIAAIALDYYTAEKGWTVVGDVVVRDNSSGIVEPPFVASDGLMIQGRVPGLNLPLDDEDVPQIRVSVKYVESDTGHESVISDYRHVQDYTDQCEPISRG